MTIKRRALLFVAAAGSLTLAACGSGDDDSNGASTAGSAGGNSETVSVASAAGIGDVLVDASGLALYVADEEADGQVRCLDGCTAFWVPLEAGAGTPTSASAVPGLGVTQRPDGTEQVTVDGRPLYTFSEDSPGSVNGDGFEDDFGDQHLTWHVVHADGSASGTPDSSPSGGLPGYGD
jgi:predicted lipoprotein with Yx(FWY)xxD motif